MTTEVKGDQAVHRELVASPAPSQQHESSPEITGFQTDESTLPEGYFLSRFFLGSMMATGLGLLAGTAAFGYAAAILGTINEDLGPDPRYVWISLVYNTALSVCLAPVGRLSDIFGRRYFFIGGGILAVVGSIVCATASSILVLIGGNVLLGVATATQLSFHFVMGELVPIRYRYVGNAGLYVFTFGGSGMGPAISTAFVVHYPSVGWRGVYWLLLAINGAALACWVLFYFPPNFQQKHRADNTTKMYWIKHFDYVGTLLFAGGFTVFLLGLSWGGSLYPWKSAAVLSSIILGFVVLVAFVLWEIYAPIKEPLIPMHLFLMGRWTASVVLLGLGAGIYYAFSVVWPTQVAVLYGNGDLMYTGYVSLIVGLGIISGQITGGCLARPIGYQRFQVMAAFTVGGIFLACAAVSNADNKATAISLILLGCFFIGWNESLCLTNATVLVRDQQEIGVAGGVAGSVRAAISAVCTAVYVSIMTNRLAETIPAQVPPAVIDAGLPAGSVADFMTALASGSASAFSKVRGVTPDIIAIGARAYQEASADAYSTVYLSTIAFSAIAVLLTWFAPNTEELMSGKVAATLGGEEGIREKTVEDA